jgi:hypothetical protein
MRGVGSIWKNVPVPVVKRVVVSAAGVVSDANPRLPFHARGLVAGLECDGCGAVALFAPTAALQNAPQQQIGFATCCIEPAQVMRPNCRDADRFGIGSAHLAETVINLHDVFARISIIGSEQAQIAARSRFGPGAIEHAHVIDVVVGVQIEHTYCGAQRGQGKVATRVVQHELRAIKRTLHMRKTKVADEAMCDALTFEPAQGRGFGRGLAAVDELEATGANAVARRVAKAFKAHESLFQENTIIVALAIGVVVIRTKSQQSLARRARPTGDCIAW